MAWLSMRSGAVGLGVAVLWACGSKSGLLAGTAALAPDSGVGAGGNAGSGGSGGIDAAADAPPPPPCRLTLQHAPLEVVAFAEGDAGSVDLALIDAGSAAQPARVAYSAISEQANFWHPELRVAELAVGAAWPESVQVTHAPVLWGFDAHNGGVITRAPAGDGIALAFYHADEASPSVIPGLKFRPFDTASWKPGNEVFIDEAGTGAFEIVAASGDGYAVAYRSASQDGGKWQPKLALLDGQGGVTLGPLPLAPEADYPGAGASVAWSGAVTLAVVAREHAVVVERLLVGGELTLIQTAEIPLLAPDHVSARPSIASHAGATWIAWREAPADDEDPPWTIRMARLTADGALAEPPLEPASGVDPVNGVSLHVSELGVFVAWTEVVDADLPPQQTGHSRIVVHHRALGGPELAETVTLPTTEHAYDPPHAMLSLSHPRSLLLGWAGTSLAQDGAAVGFVARIDCSE